MNQVYQATPLTKNIFGTIHVSHVWMPFNTDLEVCRRCGVNADSPGATTKCIKAEVAL